MGRDAALQIDARDNVVVALTHLSAGTGVRVQKQGGEVVCITVRADIPFGHKFALQEIRAGSHVVKYGEVIGMATRDIEPGDHVHIHNVESLRGRGDKL